MKRNPRTLKALAAVVILSGTIIGVTTTGTVSTNPCDVKPARLGCSTPHPKQQLSLPVQSNSTFPDISSYQGCPKLSSPVIFKVYEGNYGQDRSAYCNAAEVHRKKLYAGVYAFLRPVNPEAQADRTVEIVKAIGGVRGPIVADAEVSLPGGYVRRFLARVRQRSSNPVATYTAPGTWPGGAVYGPLWVATYGPRPGCVAGRCDHQAWQFSDAYSCHIAERTDCSINNGLMTPPVPPKPKPNPNNNKQRIAYLRTLARRHNCYRHGKKPHACYVWGKEVRQLGG